MSDDSIISNVDIPSKTGSTSDTESILSLSSENGADSNKNSSHSSSLVRNSLAETLHSASSIRKALKEMGDISSDSSGIIAPPQPTSDHSNPRHKNSFSIMSASDLTGYIILDDNNEPISQIPLTKNHDDVSTIQPFERPNKLSKGKSTDVNILLTPNNKNMGLDSKKLRHSTIDFINKGQENSNANVNMGNLTDDFINSIIASHLQNNEQNDELQSGSKSPLAKNVTENETKLDKDNNENEIIKSNIVHDDSNGIESLMSNILSGSDEEKEKGSDQELKHHSSNDSFHSSEKADESMISRNSTDDMLDNFLSSIEKENVDDKENDDELVKTDNIEGFSRISKKNIEVSKVDSILDNDFMDSDSKSQKTEIKSIKSNVSQDMDGAEGFSDDFLDNVSEIVTDKSDKNRQDLSEPNSIFTDDFADSDFEKNGSHKSNSGEKVSSNGKESNASKALSKFNDDFIETESGISNAGNSTIIDNDFIESESTIKADNVDNGSFINASSASKKQSGIDGSDFIEAISGMEIDDDGILSSDPKSKENMNIPKEKSSSNPNSINSDSFPSDNGFKKSSSHPSDDFIDAISSQLENESDGNSDHSNVLAKSEIVKNEIESGDHNEKESAISQNISDDFVESSIISSNDKASSKNEISIMGESDFIEESKSDASKLSNAKKNDAINNESEILSSDKDKKVSSKHSSFNSEGKSGNESNDLGDDFIDSFSIHHESEMNQNNDSSIIRSDFIETASTVQADIINSSIESERSRNISSHPSDDFIDAITTSEENNSDSNHDNKESAFDNDFIESVSQIDNKSESGIYVESIIDESKSNISHSVIGDDFIESVSQIDNKSESGIYVESIQDESKSHLSQSGIEADSITNSSISSDKSNEKSSYGSDNFIESISQIDNKSESGIYVESIIDESKSNISHSVIGDDFIESVSQIDNKSESGIYVESIQDESKSNITHSVIGDDDFIDSQSGIAADDLTNSVIVSDKSTEKSSYGSDNFIESVSGVVVDDKISLISNNSDKSKNSSNDFISTVSSIKSEPKSKVNDQESTVTSNNIVSEIVSEKSSLKSKTQDSLDAYIDSISIVQSESKNSNSESIDEKSGIAADEITESFIISENQSAISNKSSSSNNSSGEFVDTVSSIKSEQASKVSNAKEKSGFVDGSSTIVADVIDSSTASGQHSYLSHKTSGSSKLSYDDFINSISVVQSESKSNIDQSKIDGDFVDASSTIVADNIESSIISDKQSEKSSGSLENFINSSIGEKSNKSSSNHSSEFVETISSIKSEPKSNISKKSDFNDDFIDTVSTIKNQSESSKNSASNDFVDTIHSSSEGKHKSSSSNKRHSSSKISDESQDAAKTFSDNDFVESSIYKTSKIEQSSDSKFDYYSSSSVSSRHHHRHHHSRHTSSDIKAKEDEGVQIHASDFSSSSHKNIKKPTPKLNIDLRLNPVSYEPKEKVDQQTSSIKVHKGRRKHKERIEIPKRTYARPILQTLTINDTNTNYIGFIEEQKIQLKHIQKSTNASRQMRALRESQQLHMQYETADDDFDEVERALSLRSPLKT